MKLTRADVDKMPVGFIIDGADGTGKSTLAAGLQKILNEILPKDWIVKIQHNGPPIHDTEFAHSRSHRSRVSVAMSNYVQSNTITIFDRLHLSNYVYSVTRHDMPDTHVGLTEARRLEALTRRLGFFHILMQRPLEDVVDYLDKHEREAGGSKQHPALDAEWNLFNDLANVQKDWKDDNFVWNRISLDGGVKEAVQHVLELSTPRVVWDTWTWRDMLDSNELDPSA